MDNYSGKIVDVNEDGVLTVRLDNKELIYASQMQFIKGGGLFIATTRSYQLGDEIKVNLLLMDEQNPLLITGKVIWNTPLGAQGALTAGIGIQFLGDKAEEIRQKISTYVAGSFSTERYTDTM